MRLLLFFSFCLLVVGLRAARILVYDSLDYRDTLHPILLLNPPRPCSHYNEKPYDWHNASQETKNSIRERLLCKRLGLTYQYYYISSRKKEKCEVYDPKNNRVVEMGCRENYPSMCTNTAPKRTYNNPPTTNERYLFDHRSSFAKLKGTRTDIAFTFLGIPYAFPPVNERRFENPVCISRIKCPWDASFYRSYCPQDEQAVRNVKINEDCLYLNVYTNYIPDGADGDDMLLPVLFWIHGGSFVRGDVSSAIFDPTHLIAREDVVVVTFNYRLGALGFWGAGNQAIRDQITVLEWIQKHIKSFGGDPNKVTIAGESAGANSVRSLLSIKKIQGLFKAAFLASDVINLGYTNKSDSENILSHRMATVLKCAIQGQKIHDKNVMECMRKADAKEIVDAQSAVGMYAASYASSITGSEYYKPVIDGDLIHEDFYRSMISGSFTKVPIMMGFLKDEGYLFIPFFLPTPVLKEYFSVGLGVIFSLNEIRAINQSGLYNYYLNDSNTDNVRIALADVLTDSHWVCPSMLIISKLSKHVKVYGYYYKYPFMWQHPEGSFFYSHVCHADDIAAIFSTIAIPGINYLYGSNNTNVTENDIIFSRIFASRLGAFMRNQDPNPTDNDLCHDKNYYKDSNKKTVKWEPFKVNEKTDKVKTGFSTADEHVYGPLQELNFPEKTTEMYAVNKTICDFWFKLGFHAQIYFGDTKVYLRERMQQAMKLYGLV